MSDILNYNNQGRALLREERSAGRVKYLVFELMEERYGIPLSSVKEVIGLTEITKVPNVPDFFVGLINLRGQIISVLDLRKKLKLPEEKYKDKKTTIIITEFENVTIRTIVDDVKEVANFESSQIENKLDIQSSLGREFMTGVAKTNDNKLTLLLNIGKVLSLDERVLLKEKSIKKAA